MILRRSVMLPTHTDIHESYNKIGPTLIALPKEGALPVQLDHYVKLISNSYIKLLCEPLRQIHINYFQYAKRLPDSSYIHLTNHTDWQSHYFAKYYYLTNEFEHPKKPYETSIHLWKGMPHQEMYHCMHQTFNIGNGITFIQTYQDCTEFFHFGTDTKDQSIINFYLNHIDTLKRFMLYFKDKSWDIIEGLAQCRIILPNDEHYYPDKTEYYQNAQCFNKLIEINRYFISDTRSDIYLTKREMQCLKWYNDGKTAEEIGIICGISKRTVESYLVSIKNKLQRFNKRQLISNLIGVGL
jgi:DNA-binding CsgD family transcriptional regulator